MNHKEIYDLNILSESLISNDETFQQACDDDLMRRLALDDERSFNCIIRTFFFMRGAIFAKDKFVRI